MRRIYYYVEPCPQCGSRKTGHYIRTPFSGAAYTKEMSLKNGELIRFLSETPRNNGYCESCGYEWPTKVETKFWPYEKIREEQLARGTDTQYSAFMKNKQEAENASAGKRGILGLFGGDSGRRQDYAYEEYSSQGTRASREPEIIDLRKKDTIEILYTDDELIAEYLEVLKNT